MFFVGVAGGWRRRGLGVNVAAMTKVFDIAVAVSLLAVVTALGFGLYALYRGGDFGRSYSNKIMRARIVLQFIAVCILVAAFWWRSRGG